jgi:hypothetical protein
MSNDPKRESELDDFRQALSQGMSRMPEAPAESGLDRFREALGGAANFGVAWIADQTFNASQDFVSRVLLGDSSHENANHHVEQLQEQEEKGVER